jgi:hypothetical protein
MILLHDVIEVRCRPIPASAAQLTTLLEFANDFPIRRVTVHIDDSWARMAGSSPGFPEKPFGCGGISLRRDQIAIAERVPEIPTDTDNDALRFEM